MIGVWVNVPNSTIGGCVDRFVPFFCLFLVGSSTLLLKPYQRLGEAVKFTFEFLKKRRNPNFENIKKMTKKHKKHKIKKR